MSAGTSVLVPAGSLLSYEDIITQMIPSISWDVEPLIVQGDRVLPYGEFGSYKSWLLLDLALHIAAGKPWLGQFECQTRRCLYIDGEMSQRTLRRRVQRLGLGADISGPIPFAALSWRGQRFTGPEVAEKLLSELKLHRCEPEVIIIEALRRVLKGSENDQEALSLFWDNVNPLTHAGQTVIVSHHMKKPGNFPTEVRHMSSGNTDILAGVDAGFAIHRKPEGLIGVECVKMREAEFFEPFLVKLEDAGSESPARMTFQGYMQAPPKKLQQAKEIIIAFLETQHDSITETGVIHNHVETHYISRPTSERALAELKKDGKIERIGHGRCKLVLIPSGDEIEERRKVA